MNQLLADIIKIKLEELLISIRSNYKEHITEEDIAKDFRFICSKLTLRTKNIDNCLTKKKKIKNYKNNNFTNIPIDQRCQGRSWGLITEENGKKIYGYRCKSKKKEGSKYCYIHGIKLTHGNFLVEPDKYLKHHFEIRNKLRQKRENIRKKKDEKINNC
jgi:hypothetical protein